MKAQLAFTVFIIISIVASLSILIGREIDLSANRYTITATVTDKAVKNYDDNGRYLIYTKDSDGTILVMEIEDNIFVGQFNSSDIYAEIETGRPIRLMLAVRAFQFSHGIPTFIQRLNRTLTRIPIDKKRKEVKTTYAYISLHSLRRYQSEYHVCV